MDQLIIDRFEGDTAVCEKPDRTMINIPRAELPPEAREGDVIVIEDGRAYIDTAATAARKKAAKEALKRLWKK